MDARLEEYVRGQWLGLVRYATLLCGDASEAEEPVQTTLTRVVVRWRFIRDKDNPDGYVKRALVRAAIDSGKRRRREPSLEVLPELGGGDASTAVGDRDEVRRALAVLPPRQRAMLVLRYLDDASEATTAEVLGCSIGTVKSTTSKALARLREVLSISELEEDLR